MVGVCVLDQTEWEREKASVSLSPDPPPASPVCCFPTGPRCSFSACPGRGRGRVGFLLSLLNLGRR